MAISRIVFIGTSEYAVPALTELIKSEKYKPCLVITQADKEQGRKLILSPTPVGQMLYNTDIPLLKPMDINSEEIYQKIESFQPDILITASYGGMIGRSLRQLSPLGAINLHPSLLPKYRGADPIRAALFAGDKETGISIFRLSAKLDAGDILLQKQVAILPEDDYSSLHDHLSEKSAQLLIEFLDALPESPPQGIKQDATAASYTRKLHKADQIIQWNLPAYQIHNQIRALSKIPGASTSYQGNTIKILRSEILKEDSKGEPGTVYSIVRGDGIIINTADKQLMIKQIQSAGKKSMPAHLWVLGSRIKPGDCLQSNGT